MSIFQNKWDFFWNFCSVNAQFICVQFRPSVYWDDCWPYISIFLSYRAKNCFRSYATAETKFLFHGFQKKPSEVFYKKGVLKNFAKFTRSHLFFEKVAALRTTLFLEKRLRDKYFTMNTSGRLL